MKRKYKEIKQTHRLKYLNEKITKSDFVYKIKEFIMKVNLSALEETLNDSGRGPHPIPLWIPLAVWLYAYSKGNQNYREVSNLCKSDDYYYWLSCGFEPSSSYFESWKLKIFPMIPKLATDYRSYLCNNKLLNNKMLGLDGVKIETWASLKQSKTEKSIDKEIERLDESLKEKTLTEKVKKKIIKRKRKLAERKTELQIRKKKASNLTDKEKDKMRINITSPSTVILHKRNGKIIQGINGQCIINQDQIINVISAERKSTDYGLLGRLYDKLSLFLKIAIIKIILLADSGYWELDDVNRFDPAKGYNIVMPSPAEVAQSRNRKLGRKPKGLSYDQGFKLDAKKEHIICPMDKILRRQGKITDKAKIRQIIYRASSKDCSSCVKKKECLGDIKSPVKQISLTQDSEEALRMKDHYKKHQEEYKKRGIINEPVHSQMFNNLNINKLHCIIDECIDGELELIALLHTLKKIEIKYGSIFPVPLEISVLYFLLFWKIRKFMAKCI
jgi:hypothetical protein